MTIPKNAGLSHLADAAAQARADGEQILYSYPIKKRRQPRQLRPNQAGIAWLEEQSKGDTEIFEIRDRGDSCECDDCDGENVIEWHFCRANGWYGAKLNQMYPRPMFETLDLDASSSNMINYAKPCPDCDDWSRTARCDLHPDEGYDGLDKGNRRRYERERESAHRPAAPRGGSLAARQVAPEWERWERLAQEWERRNGIPLADAVHRNALTRWADRVAGLPNGTIEINGTVTPGTFRLEVNGETVQGIQSFTIHTEESSVNDL